MVLVYEIFIGYAYTCLVVDGAEWFIKNRLKTIVSPYSQIFVIPINLWEMSIKYHKGKWDEAKLLIRDFERLAIRNEFSLLPITLQHARMAGSFSQTHADPFDRMLVAQAMSENLTLISKDSKLTKFNINLLW